MATWNKHGKPQIKPHETNHSTWCFIHIAKLQYCRILNYSTCVSITDFLIWRLCFRHDLSQENVAVEMKRLFENTWIVTELLARSCKETGRGPSFSVLYLKIFASTIISVMNNKSFLINSIILEFLVYILLKCL